MSRYMIYIPYILYIAMAVTIVYLILTAVHAGRLVKAAAPITEKSEHLKAMAEATNGKVSFIKDGTSKMVNTGKKLLPLALLLLSIQKEYNDDENADWKTSAKRALRKKKERDEIVKLAVKKMR